MTDLVHLVAGGALIGAGAAVLALANGRIAGISGAFGNLLDGDAGPQRWRLGFLLGLLLPALFLLLNDAQVATLLFMGAAMATVYVVRHVVQG